ncbi:MAG: ankyrin repeat domain-containing protein [Candidatus Goldiibacteriota bacterium]
MGKALNEQLLIAIKHNDRERASKLIDSGADVNFSDSSGLNPLYWAAAFGNDDMVEFLIQNGADDLDDSIAGFMVCQSAFSDKKFGSFIYTVSRGSIEVAKALLDSGIDIKNRKKREKEVLASALSVSYNDGLITKEELSSLTSVPEMRFLILKAVSDKRKKSTKKQTKKKIIAKKQAKKKTTAKKHKTKKSIKKKK